MLITSSSLSSVRIKEHVTLDVKSELTTHAMRVCGITRAKVVTLTKFKLGFPFLSRLVRSFVCSLPPSTLHKETPTTCIASTFCVVDYKKTH